MLWCLLLSTQAMQAQNVNVSGNVQDDQGQPVIGATVKVQGSKTGAITDLDGNFTISAPKGSKLEISYVGFKPMTVTAGSSPVKVTMQEDESSLNEVVVIGYGTVKRKDVTGAVASVGGKELQKIPVASPVEALQGKLAGVRVTIPEGSPDAEVVVRVRGGGSITRDNTPLYIVDGFPVNSINDIPASDIESIDVLKDASSTAIYGSRGANGIILITTKSGKTGKVQVNYNAYYGFKKAAKKYDMVNFEDYLKWQYENAALQGGDKLDRFENIIGGWSDLHSLAGTLPQEDWQDVIYGRTGNVFNHNLNISGGSEKLRFNFGYNWMKSKEIVLGSDFNKQNLNFKLNYQPTKKVTLELSARYSYTKIYGDGQSDATGDQNSLPSGSFSRIRQAVLQTPIKLDMTGESVLNDDDIDSGMENPVTALNDNYKRRFRQNLNMAGAFTWNIWDNLNLRTDFGLDVYENNLSYFWGSTTYESQNNAQADYKNMPLVTRTIVHRRIFRNTNTLNYDFKSWLPESHSLSLLLGQENIITHEDVQKMRVEGLPDFYDASMAFRFLAQGNPTAANDYYYPDDKMISFFGRVNYSYLDRYLLTGTLRADGSSKFTRGNRWGWFPSVAAAWRITEEPWMKASQNWLSNLKLRLSYGVTGNNNIPSGQTERAYSVMQKSWLNFADNWLTAGFTLINPDLKWETTHSVNLGIDYGFFHNRLNGSFELYTNTVKDLLMLMQVGGSGYNTQYQNVGETRNRGFEFTANYVAINKPDYGLNFSFTLGHNKNEVRSLGSMDSYTTGSYWASTEIGGDYIVKPGEPVGSMIGYRSDGRYSVDDFTGFTNGKWVLKEGVPDASGVVGEIRPGAMKLKDLTGDGTVNEDDKSIIGDANAWAVGGFSIAARVKGFDFNANFTYSIGNDIYNADKLDATETRGGLWHNLGTDMAEGKRWTNIDASGNLCNDPVQLAELNKNTTMWSPSTSRAVFTDWAVEDGSFLRLSDITLGYTVPKSLTKKVWIDNLRFYFTASNLFCITGYSGPDPEVDCKRNYLVTPGVGYFSYPRCRQYIFGVNISF